jgi:Xaa-Pro aminopeptidase
MEISQQTAVQPRIAALREAMRRQRVDACMVPSADPHLSEYLPARWQGRAWLSGFTGSVGTLIVTMDFAGLWTDARYWTQAEQELAGSGIALMKIPSGASVLYVDWLAANLRAGQTLAVDGAVLGLATARLLDQALAPRDVLLRTDLDLLDEVWRPRPALPAAPVFEHAPQYACASRAAKLAELRAAMAAHGAASHIISTLDDIAWLFNLRGSDVNFNPVFLAHALIDGARATLFVAEGKIDAELGARLAADGVTLAPYAGAAAALAALPSGATLLIDPRRVTLAFREQVASGVRVVEAINPSTLLKSRKSADEAAQVREAMRQDGAAMCEFYAAFEAALAAGEPMTELTIDERLSAARARRPGFVGLSFATIAAFNANGAMPHYHATAESHARIEGDGLLLIDSGGQYLGGTTDITRVWPVGTLSDAIRRDCTRVLKGTLALSRTRFPRDTPSPMLDAIARAPLWAEGLDYGHGTGHGVGYFLNVHEGPQSISRSLPEPSTAMEPGMITSIEPGLYRPGRWGVRIENLVLNVPAAVGEGGATQFGEFLEFETLTLCPIDVRCLERGLLAADEIDWLNRYHAMVRERLAPLVEGAALAWLIERTKVF